MQIHVYDPDRHVLDTENGSTIRVPNAITNAPSVLLEAESVERWARLNGLIDCDDLVACAAA